MTTQTVFDLATIPNTNPARNVSGFPLPSGTPIEGDTISFNATNLQWTYAQTLSTASSVSLATNQTITGEKTFTGGVVIGANGTTIGNIDYRRDASGAVPGNGSVSVNISFGTFTATPTIVATASSDNNADPGLAVIINSVTFSSATVKLQNYTAGATTGNIVVNWIAIGV